MVEDVICWSMSIIAACRFLVQAKLLLVERWICPLTRVNGLYMVVVVVNDDDVSSKCHLNCVHPMGVDNARCNFEFCVVWLRSTWSWTSTLWRSFVGRFPYLLFCYWWSHQTCHGVQLDWLETSQGCSSSHGKFSTWSRTLDRGLLRTKPIKILLWLFNLTKVKILGPGRQLCQWHHQLWCSLLSISVPGDHFRPIQECSTSTILLPCCFVAPANPYNGMYQSKSSFHFTTKHTIIPVVDSTCCFF